MKDLLPLGSIVMLKKGDKKLMIYECSKCKHEQMLMINSCEAYKKMLVPCLLCRSGALESQ